LESTPKSRRQKMIDVGMAEDPDYTIKALQYVMTFEDILALPDPELAELVAKAPGKMTAFAISSMDEEVRDRFLRCAQPAVAAEIKDFLQVETGPREIGGAQMKLITTARELERAGYIRTKQIPVFG